MLLIPTYAGALLRSQFSSRSRGLLRYSSFYKNESIKRPRAHSLSGTWRHILTDTAQHHIQASSTTAAAPPKPTQSLQLENDTEISDGEGFRRFSGFWQSLENTPKSQELDEPIDHGEDDGQELVPTHSTPSARLLAALQSAGLSALLPKIPPNKSDLSFFDARKFEAVPTKTHRTLTGRGGSADTVEVQDVKALADVLTLYITHVPVPPSVLQHSNFVQDETYDKALTKVFTPDTLSLLNRRGHTPEDIAVWSWILTSKSTDQAVRRLSTISSTLFQDGRRPVPLFVFLFILRSESMSAASLKLLMNCLWTRSSDTTLDDQFLFRHNEIPEQVAIILIVRLIRHARRVWPDALGEIISLMTRLIGSTGEDAIAMKPAQIQRMSHIYNRVLSLVSQPTSAHPFRAVALQQQAQFQILRKMIQMKPPLPITREGFRALARVQVAHKKTDSERHWARFKALSWPPWKEAKSGIDADDEIAGSRSRAIDVLTRMQETGYYPLSWEKQAQVFAGWDTDRSPVIQKRKWLSRSPLVRSAWALDASITMDPERDEEIWAARISATRTIKEAWACFCTFEKTNKNSSLAPWHAMFEKLLNSNQDIRGHNVTPGDGRETYPEPTSPHDFLYVPTEPPSAEELFDRMVARGVRPAGRLLIDLLDHATTISWGLKYISHSRFPEVTRDIFSNAEKYDSDYIREILSRTPDAFFAAFVRLLVRCGHSRSVEFRRPASAASLNGTYAKSKNNRVRPFTYAFHLVTISETQYLPAWGALLAGLNQHARTSAAGQAHYDAVYRAWGFLRVILGSMKTAGIAIDFACLQEIYPTVEEVMLCSEHFGTFSERSLNRYIERGSRTVRRLFHDIVVDSANHPSTSWLPIDAEARALSIPSPANLPGIVRVLGISGDTNGIMGLLRWMSRFSIELEAVSKELSNGTRMLRRTLLLMRVFLERNWAGSECQFTSPADQSVLDEAIALTQKHEVWGGWPSDEDVRRFLDGKRNWVSRIEELERARLAKRLEKQDRQLVVTNENKEDRI